MTRPDLAALERLALALDGGANWSRIVEGLGVDSCVEPLSSYLTACSPDAILRLLAYVGEVEARLDCQNPLDPCRDCRACFKAEAEWAHRRADDASARGGEGGP